MNSTRLHLTVSRAGIAWLKFLLESYEGLALLRTLDPASGRVVLYIGPGAEAETAGLLDAVRDEIGLVSGLSDDFSAWVSDGTGNPGPGET